MQQFQQIDPFYMSYSEEKTQVLLCIAANQSGERQKAHKAVPGTQQKLTKTLR